MVDRVLFQMWGPFRDGLIANHRFYVSEARTRLLSQFGTMKEDADRYADDWLANRAPYFNPDRDDPADAYEPPGQPRALPVLQPQHRARQMRHDKALKRPVGGGKYLGAAGRLRRSGGGVGGQDQGAHSSDMILKSSLFVLLLSVHLSQTAPWVLPNTDW